MGIREALEALGARRDLSTDDARAAMSDIVGGRVAPPIIEEFAAALRAKGETADELTAMARVLRETVVPVAAEGSLLDAGGTGSDGLKSFNISTVAAVIAAAAGVRVAKQHGPAVSSRCGSTELLQELGIAHDLPPEAAARCIRETGLGFLSTARYHAAGFKNLFAATDSASRSLMHLLALLAHPARARHQLIGVANAQGAATVAEVLRRLGTTHTVVVHGHDGMDEITCTGTSTVHEVVGDTLRTWTVDPREFGYLLAPRHAILGGLPPENALITRFLFEGKSSAYRNSAEMNAAAALLAADRVSSLVEGVALARSTISSGAALDKLQQVATVSRRLATA